MRMVKSKNIYMNVLEDVSFGVESLEELLNAVLQAVNNTLHKGDLEKPYELSLKFSDDQTVQVLNKQFRGKDKPTNVLSFPGDEEIPGEELETVYIGDIIIAKETVAKEAKAQSKNFTDHLSHLIIHGILHLYGFDHIEEVEAEEMESLEVRILSALNIADPYK